MGIDSFVILPAHCLAGLRQQTVFPEGWKDTHVFRLSVHFIKPKLIFTNSNGIPAFRKWRNLLFFSSCINYLVFQASWPIRTASGLRLTNMSFLHKEKQIPASSLHELFFLNLSFTSQSISISPKYTCFTSTRVQGVCELSRFLAVLVGLASFCSGHLPDPPEAFKNHRVLRKEQGLWGSACTWPPALRYVACGGFLASRSLSFLTWMPGRTEPSWRVVCNIKLVPFWVVSLYFPPPVTYLSPFFSILPF